MAYETVKLKDKETGKKEPVKFKVGGLHKSLGVPQDKDLPKGIMEKIKKMKVGEKVKVMGKEITITATIKRQATLGLNLMGKKCGDTPLTPQGGKGERISPKNLNKIEILF